MKKSSARYLSFIFPYCSRCFSAGPGNRLPGGRRVLPGFTRPVFLVDANDNQLPDHLGFTVLVKGNYAGEKFWLCGELQALVGDEWQTLAYTAQEFDWAGTPVEASIYFYGGEIRRLQQDGPFRLFAAVEGGRREQAGVCRVHPVLPA